MPVPNYLRAPSVFDFAGSSGQTPQVGTPKYTGSAPVPYSSLFFKGPVSGPVWSWTGLYLGVHVGAATGITKFVDPFGTSIYGDDVPTPGFLGGGQIGGDWQVPNSRWVLGVQADISGLSAEGTSTCLASSGNAINATCRVTPNATSTVTGRIGYATGPAERTLIYAKGGIAWADSSIDMALNNGLAPGIGPAITSNSSNLNLWGWTAGGGVEYALTPAWTLFAEYDYLGFHNTNVANLGSTTVSPLGAITAVVPPSSSGVTQNIQEIKLGLNYKLGANPWASGLPTTAITSHGPFSPLPGGAGWEVEIGGRYMFSWGQFHKDLGQPDSSGLPTTSSISRLTYNDNATSSGEFFARLDTPWKFFVKGFVGTGVTTSGHMNDEDFGIPFGPSPIGAIPPDSFIPYSNTLSGNVKGNIGYGVVDAGYDFWKGSSFKAGPFVGYTQFHQDQNAYGCVQIANMNSDCAGASSVSSSTLGITENDTWQALRVELNGEAMVTDRSQAQCRCGVSAVR